MVMLYSLVFGLILVAFFIERRIDNHEHKAHQLAMLTVNVYNPEIQKLREELRFYPQRTLAYKFFYPPNIDWNKYALAEEDEEKMEKNAEKYWGKIK